MLRWSINMPECLGTEALIMASRTISLIIPGDNDGKYVTVGPEKFASPDYKKYIHDRCNPGTSFEAPGELPPPVEVHLNTFRKFCRDSWQLTGNRVPDPARTA
jgi:hypothetical protein